MSSHRVSSSCSKYDVFLSFRGEDTRRRFIDHLSESLKRKDIVVFRDDKKLEKGKPIRDELLKAIEVSKFSIVVLSRNYASSTWCLDELAKIVHCMNTMEQTVIPIFYDVDPSVVRKQTRYLKKIFDKHAKDFKENLEKVQTWKRALTQVANCSGWDARDRSEPILIRDVVKDILRRLSNPPAFKDIVGIDSSLEKLRNLLRTKTLDDVCMIGICGMGGIGKTTLAKVVFKLMSCEFDGSSFLDHVREVSNRDVNGLVSLQKQLLSECLWEEEEIQIYNTYSGSQQISRRLKNQKVLLIVDDVDHIVQLKNLAGNHDWFGSGSRIIITTRDKQLLKAYGVDGIYDVEELNNDDALELFSLKAFRNLEPPEDYLKLSNHVAKYCSGLPLALEVLGACLFGKTIDEWKDALKVVERSGPRKEILDSLEISFNGLHDVEKQIFLDIACFFKGLDKGYVTKILNDCHYGISVLIDKCLITISMDNQVLMHDLLQEMGQRIVKRECLHEPGNRSRLWEKDDVVHVLTKNTGTEKVEGIMLEEELNESASAEAFSKMINLRLLKINKLKLPKAIQFLSNKLQLLVWHGYPLKSLPPNLRLDNIVEFDMSYSNIQQLWERNQPFEELKFIKLRDCTKLMKAADITKAPNIEELIYEGCTKLQEIDPPHRRHKKIKRLLLGKCTNLRTFPKEFLMESLEELDLSDCPNIEIKEEEEKLDIRGTAVRLPPWLQRYLELFDCFTLTSNLRALRLPSLSGCRSLDRLNLRNCNIGAGGIPHEIGELKLSWLDLSENNFSSLPTSISQLTHLKSFLLTGCKNLRYLPDIPYHTYLLVVDGCVSLERSSDPLRLSSPSALAVCFFAINCPKYLPRNTTAFSMLKDILMSTLEYTRSKSREYFAKDVFHVIVPGSEIPEWCHQKEGCSTTIKRHPPMHRSSQLIGYVLCCVFVIHKHPPILNRTGATHALRFDISPIDQDVYSKNVPGCSFGNKSVGATTSEHIWVVFVSRRRYISGKIQDMYNPIKFSFGIDFGPGLEIKRCGGRPIYEQDIADQFNQSGGSTAWNLNKFRYEDFCGPTIEDDDESNYCQCFSLDRQTKAAAISHLYTHRNQLALELMHYVRSSTGVVVNIETIPDNDYGVDITHNDNDVAQSSESDGNANDEELDANFWNLLVPKLNDYIKSIMGVNTSMGSRIDSDEGESRGNYDEKLQPKRLQLRCVFT